MSTSFVPWRLTRGWNPTRRHESLWGRSSRCRIRRHAGLTNSVRRTPSKRQISAKAAGNLSFSMLFRACRPLLQAALGAWHAKGPRLRLHWDHHTLAHIRPRHRPQPLRTLTAPWDAARGHGRSAPLSMALKTACSWPARCPETDLRPEPSPMHTAAGGKSTRPKSQRPS